MRGTWITAIAGALMFVSPGADAQTAQTARTPTLPEIEAEIKTTSDHQTIPTDESLRYLEINRIEGLLAQYRPIASREPDTDDEQTLNSAATAFEQWVARIATVDCADDEVSGRFIADLSNLQRALFFALPRSKQAEFTALFPRSDRQSGCTVLKKALSDPRRVARVTAFIAEARAEIQKEATADQAVVRRAGELIAALEARRAEIRKRLQNRSTLTDQLWLVILIIGALSIGAIWVVKSFAHDLQVEWVASGQVIQFVTVMILLSVVMALGLADILQENTLGTLLGGIAGHVLSQGVGRAAAREVSRNVAPRRNSE
jgi:hypothetical protein